MLSFQVNPPPIELTKLFPEIFFGTPGDKEIRELNRWLRANRDKFVRLFHGTKKKYPIIEQGLLPCGRSRRNSLQSASGFVCLSVFPRTAEDFGRLGGNYNDEVVVYAVDTLVANLKPDTDQLRNRRMWGGGHYSHVGNTLADSLVYGSGARVKGKIYPNVLSIWIPPDIPAASPEEAKIGNLRPPMLDPGLKSAPGSAQGGHPSIENT